MFSRTFLSAIDAFPQGLMVLVLTFLWAFPPTFLQEAVFKELSSCFRKLRTRPEMFKSQGRAAVFQGLWEHLKYFRDSLWSNVSECALTSEHKTTAFPSSCSAYVSTALGYAVVSLASTACQISEKSVSYTCIEFSYKKSIVKMAHVHFKFNHIS